MPTSNLVNILYLYLLISFSWNYNFQVKLKENILQLRSLIFECIHLIETSEYATKFILHFEFKTKKPFLDFDIFWIYIQILTCVSVYTCIHTVTKNLPRLQDNNVRKILGFFQQLVGSKMIYLYDKVQYE